MSGERCAAYVEKIEFGGVGGMYLEHILVADLDPVLEQPRRYVSFDLDDRDAAIAELDRMPAEIADERNTPS